MVPQVTNCPIWDTTFVVFFYKKQYFELCRFLLPILATNRLGLHG